MPDTAVKIGYGSSFSIDRADSPLVYDELAEVFSITPPSASVDMVDATHMQSPNQTREFISGLNDPGECSLEMNYIPGNASDNILLAILALPVGATRRRTCKIVYPNHIVDTFSGELMTYEPTLPVDDRMTATVTFKVSGIVTRSLT